jgi:hypothetical protein
MTPSRLLLGSALALGLPLVAAAQDVTQVSDMEEAIDRYRNGRPLTGQIDAELALEAADLALDASVKELRAYIAIARGGGKTTEVVLSLIDRFSEAPFEQLFVAAEVHRIGRDATGPAARQRPDWPDDLLEVIDGSRGSPPPFVVDLFAWHAKGPYLRDLLEDWAEADPPPPLLRFLVQQMGLAEDASGAFEALVSVELPRSCLPTLKSALRALMERPGIYERLAKLLREGQTSPALYRALATVPPRKFRAVKKFVLRRLKVETGDNLAALITTCNRLALGDALPGVLAAASGGTPEVRAVALAALPRLLGAARRRQDLEELRSEAESAVRLALGGEGEVLAAAIVAAQGLNMQDEVELDVLLDIAQDDSLGAQPRASAIMLAATRAPKQDIETLEVLVGLTRDREVSKKVYFALQRVAGMRFPSRPEPWERWLHTFKVEQGRLDPEDED